MKNISAFIKTILFCLQLSWKSSRFYTAIRLLFRTASPLLPLLSSFALKYLIDRLAGAGEGTGLAALLPYVGVICACSALSMALETISQYCEAMHGELLSRYLRLEMMEISLTADIEIYDNKEFYNQFTALKQDVQLNCTPFVRQCGILSNERGVILCQKEYQTNGIHQSSSKKLWKLW